MSEEELTPNFKKGQIVRHRASGEKAIIIMVVTNLDYVDYEISTGFYFGNSKIKYCTVFEIELEACHD